jgi:hypothetical protein
MKKIFTLALLFSATVMVAQSNRSNPSQLFRFDQQTSINPNYSINNSRAIGDTIFFFDRLNYRRTNQLPIMPTLGFNFTF